LLILVCLIPASASARQVSDEHAALIKTRWTAILTDVIREHQLEEFEGPPVTAGASPARRLRTIANDAAETDRQAVRLAYAEVIRRFLADPSLAPLFKPDPDAVNQVSTAADQEAVKRLADAVTKESGAKALNAGLTNPVAPRAAERSGITDLLALALDSQDFLAADKTAVTISLNALAVLGMNDATRSAPALYRKHEFLRRIGGSFTFGAQLPEGEITGLTGLPSAENLFDVFAWDAKVRLFGDRDPRARRWHEPLQAIGVLNLLSADSLGLVPVGDATIIQELLLASQGERLSAAKKRLTESAQVSLKSGGQHLTKEAGKNKYTFAVLADKGFGRTDLTANVAYSVVDDVTLAPGSVFTLKTWTAAFALNHLVAEGLIEEGRSIELSLNANFEIPVATPGLPDERKRQTKIVGAVSIPWGAAASIPVSITYANDPNKVSDEKYVTGHVGISWDFGAMKSLFQPRSSK